MGERERGSRPEVRTTSVAGISESRGEVVAGKVANVEVHGVTAIRPAAGTAQPADTERDGGGEDRPGHRD